MEERAVLVRKYGVTSRDNLVNKDDDGGEEKLENISSTATGGPNDLLKFRIDSVASCDSGIGDCALEVDPETGLEVICLEEVSYHDTREDGWLVIFDKVYQVTEYLMKHPGGEEVMMEYLGYDATMAFRGVGHSEVALRTLQAYVVGILPRRERMGLTPDI